MPDCLSDSDLHRYHAKELDQAEEARVREHLAGCEKCAQRDAELVAEHEELVRQIKVVGASDPAELPPTEPAQAPMPGDVAGDQSWTPVPNIEIEGYELVRELHRGGQGIVYQAVQKATKRKVAIKVLLEGPFASESARRRFEREVELVASLKHPNIISIFHSGQTRDGHPFCAMDYVRGVPLNHYLHDKKLTLEEALKLFTTVCEAVNYAHQKGVMHRDLKPANILVDVNGVPKVLDFGLAKMVGGPEQTLISLTGHVVGTLPYMSPEQVRGNPDEIDTRTDVYALGVILYEMLTGQYPYPVVGQMAEVFKNITEMPPTPPSRQWKSGSGVTRRSSRRLRPGQCPIDDEVQTIVLKTLSKERKRRYQSAAELARDIDHYLANEPIEAKRDSGLYVLKKTLRRYKGQVTFAAMIAVVIIIAGILSTIFWRQAAAQRDIANRQKKELAARKSAETMVTRASILIQGGGKNNLLEARSLLNEAIAAVPDLEQSYIHRGQLTIIEGLRARIEDKQHYVSAALEDFEQAHVSAGGQRWHLGSADPPDVCFVPGVGSQSAIDAAMSLLLLTRQEEQATRLLTSLGGLATPRATAFTALRFYTPDTDPLVVSQEGPDTPATARLTPNRQAVLHRVLRSEVGTLDPTRSSATEVTELLFDSLFVIDARLQCKPNPVMVDQAIASEDGLTWTITLKNGLKWHDGEPFTATDIEFTWQLMDSNRRAKHNLNSIRAIDELHVEFVHKEAVATSEWDMAFYPLPKHIYDQSPRDFAELMARQPVGNGPYAIRKLSDSEVVLERWDDYPDPPYFQRIHFHVLPDRAKCVASLAAGLIDDLELTGTEFRWDVNGASFDENIVKVYHPRQHVEYICWNINGPKGLFVDDRVRRAIAHAVDLRPFIRSQFGDIYSPCNGICYPGAWMVNDRIRPLKCDPPEAERLLAAAGWIVGDGEDGVRVRDGVRFEFNLLVPWVSLDIRSVAADLERHLRKVGVAMHVEIASTQEYLSRMASRDFDALVVSAVGAVHPDLERAQWQTDGARNYGGYSNREVDQLYAEARSLPNQRDQRRYYQRIQELIYKDQPCLFLWWRPSLWALNRRLRGVEFSPRGLSNFYPGVRAWWVAVEGS